MRKRKHSSVENHERDSIIKKATDLSKNLATNFINDEVKRLQLEADLKQENLLKRKN